jgi:hypothetical protein
MKMIHVYTKMTGTYLLKVSQYNLTIIKHISCISFREDIGNKKCYVQMTIFLEAWLQFS